MATEQELADLQASNAARVQRLAQQGAQLQTPGNLYLTVMLEHLCGDAVNACKYEAETRFAALLDSAEPAVARAHILGQGRPLGPAKLNGSR